MDNARQIEALERALLRLGVTVREEALPEEAHLDGGLCTIRGKRFVYVAPDAPLHRKVAVLLSAMRRLPHEQVWLPPELRAKVQEE